MSYESAHSIPRAVRRESMHPKSSQSDRAFSGMHFDTSDTSKHRLEILLTKLELKQCFTLRSWLNCKKHYVVGETRKVKDKDGCSYGIRIKILSIRYIPSLDKSKIRFRKLGNPYRHIPIK